VAEPRLFRFDLLDRTGVFLGLGVTQLAILAAGTLLTTIALTAGLPLLVALAPVTGAGLAAFGRVRQQRIVDLAPTLARWIARRDERRWYAPLPLLNPNANDRQPPLPRWLAGLELHDAPDSWGRLARSGIVHDTTRQQLATLVRVRGQGFALAARDEQVRLLTGWGDVLAGLCTERGAVRRLTWSDFSTPTGVLDHRRWVDHQPPVDTAAADDYHALLDSTAARAARHEVIVTLTVDAQQATRRDTLDRAATALGTATDALLRGLRNAGLEADDPMTSSEIAALLRARLDPRPIVHGTGSLAARLGVVSLPSAGPLVTDVQWDAIAVDGSWHRAYWIAEWPRLQQHPDWMEPVLAFGGTASRAVTVIFEPVAPSVSQRRVERDSIKLESDASSREDKGRRVNAHHRRLQAAVAEREAELVAGYAEVAYAALITVTADTRQQLFDAGDETEQLAREHGLELRPLDGRHDLGVAAALPLGLGLARTWIR
jgi:hypothetical protein